MEGPLSKWTNVVQGWQFRWFVLDLAMGVLSYYTSRDKMIRGERRGCVKLKNAQMGINDEDDSTFTITVDSKVFHFQARNAEERQRWLDALQEARDLHTENYALLQHTSRLLDSAVTVSEFDRRIIEADAYLQILIDQHQAIDQQLSHHEQLPRHSCESIKRRLQHLIELVKKTIVCLQFAKENPKAPMVNLCTNALCHAPSVRQLVPTTAPGSSSAGSSLSGLSYRGLCIDNHAVASAECTPTSSSLTTMESTVTHHQQQNQEQRLNQQQQQSTLRIAVPTTSEVDEAHSTSEQCRSRPQHLKLRDVPAVSYSSSEEEDDIYYDTRENVASLSPTASNTSDICENGFDAKLNREDYLANSAGSGRGSPRRSAGQSDLEKGRFGSPRGSTIEDFTTPGISTVNNQLPAKYSRIFAYDPLYDDDDEKDLGSLQSEGSVISYLLSQLRIGMDLTRITLPTFILEKRSTLEMYADFLAHPDLWVAIGDGETPQARLIACLRWYLSAFHAGRKTPVCKKPYNPILGEVFRCCYYLSPASTCVNLASPPSSSKPLLEEDIPAVYPEEEMERYGPIPYASEDCVVFLAEQVSHHPPISAFYAEYIPKHIQVSGHIWTKSKFLGLSIGVEMVGSATIVLLDRPGEEYVVTFPSAYGRNILGVPWVELGGQCSVTCAKTGYSADVNFLTKPFYGGKKDQIRAKAFGPESEKPFFTVEGEWNGQMIGRWAENGKEELFVDTKTLPIMQKQVRPRSQQLCNESRKLWESVTQNLKQGNIDAATDAKSLLEQRQRREAAARLEARQRWIPFYFTEERRCFPTTSTSGASDTYYRFKWPLTSRCSTSGA
ncbi:Oxysterol-binding protein-related protein 9 [Taenia crassiceps]|uniref:Oxysterol-binding protein n=1 Tax=Taenia crassiceps TaxID=6207 RepID=A0ABR4Q5B7_9CEST